MIVDKYKYNETVQLVSKILYISTMVYDNQSSLKNVLEIYMILENGCLARLVMHDPYYFSDSSIPQTGSFVHIDGVNFDELKNNYMEEGRETKVTTLDLRKWL